MGKGRAKTGPYASARGKARESDGAMLKRELIGQSIDYLLRHLDEGVTIKAVADHFHYSESYFSRVFKAVTGVSVYAFFKHLKLDQSAIDIKLKHHRAITDIGLYYGYSSSNYSSAFSQHHGLSPAAFRKSAAAASIANPFCPETVDCFEAFEAYDSRIRIAELQDMPVVYERVYGSYGDLEEKWYQFLAANKELIHDQTLMIERFYDDPAIASGSTCLCDLCLTSDRAGESGSAATIRGGRFAVYRYEGEIRHIFRALQGIFTVWFPRSGYEMAEKYGLNIYQKVDRESGCVVMDLCIPVK